MKLSKRLEAIASFINKEDNVCDVGCDHGYLDIYLAINKKNKIIIATDISSNVIKSTIDNIKKYDLEDKIKVYCTDGTKNIKENFDTIVLSGLGAHTIIDIINDSPKVDKLIISSNNNWDLIRKYFTKISYNIIDELLIYENNKEYSIMLFNKGKKKKYQKSDLLIGKYNSKNIEVYRILLNKYQRLLNNIPYKNVLKRVKIKYIIFILKKYLRKEDRIITS